MQTKTKSEVQETPEQREIRMKGLLQEITQIQKEIMGVGKKTLEHVLQAGELLVQYRDANKGNFTKLIKENAKETGISWKTAHNYVNVYKAKRDKTVKFQDEWTITDAYMAVGIMKEDGKKKKKAKAQRTEDREDKQTKELLQIRQPHTVKAVMKDKQEIVNLLTSLLADPDALMAMIGDTGLLIKFEAVAAA